MAGRKVVFRREKLCSEKSWKERSLPECGGLEDQLAVSAAGTLICPPKELSLHSSAKPIIKSKGVRNYYTTI